MYGFRFIIEYSSNTYALNFGAFGTFSPLNILSAPTFLPLLGHPYFGPNTLHETAQLQITANKRKNNMVLPFFMDTELKRFKPTNIFQKLQPGW